MKSCVRALVTAASLLALSGCDSLAPNIFDPSRHDIVDPEHDLTREDYINVLKPDAPLELKKDGPYSAYNTTVSGGANGEPPIPDVAPILAAPQPPRLGETKLVSLAVTDDVPLKDVLLELSRLADVDIEIDAGITGGIAFRAKDKPFNEVVERICDLAGLRYRMKNNVLRVERDTPYIEIYTLDFLNLDRSVQSTVNISTNVLSSGGGSSSSSGGSSGGSSGSSGSGSGGSGGSNGGGGGLNTGSQSSITASATSDFWKQFEAGVQQILNFVPVSHVGQANIPVQAATVPSAASVLAPDSAVTAAAPAAAVPTPPAPAAPISTAKGTVSGNQTEASEKPFYILNRQASTLTVSATDKQHRLVKEFLRKMQANASAQVLIEAKIVEVTLNRAFQSGIDWTKLGTDKINFVSKFGSVTNASAATLAFNFNNNKNFDLQAAVKLAETFGTTRTLSSPRLHAINNQQAVLTFAQNQVYFQLSIERQTTAGTTSVTDTVVNSEIKTVPIGIILTILPAISLNTDEVTLNVRPTLSRVTGFVSDPAVAYLANQSTGAARDIVSQIPVVEVRELDSILKLRSGQVMVIGGLMEDKSTNTENGLPGLDQVPIVGNLFKGIDRSNDTKELVIFIRATIVDSRGGAPEADKAVYEKFIRDPRPIAF